MRLKNNLLTSFDGNAYPFLTFQSFLIDFIKQSDLREALIQTFSESSLLAEEEVTQYLDRIIFFLENEKPLYNRWIRINGDKGRVINVPKEEIQGFFDTYVLDLIKKYKTHPSCHGGERGWSPRRSLESHLPCSEMFSFDLSDAFENACPYYVFDFFLKILPNFDGSLRRNLAGILSTLCIVSYGGGYGLPQGASHSMALFNRIFCPLDEVLHKKSQERGFTYSRWVDDINISSPKPRELADFLGAVDFVGEHFPISQKKMYFQQTPKDIYVLGHVISNRNQLRKNNREEKLRHKDNPLNFSDYFGETKRYSHRLWA